MDHRASECHLSACAAQIGLFAESVAGSLTAHFGQFALNAPLPGVRDARSFNASYYSTAPQYLARDFASGFTASGLCAGGCGPIGLVFDSTNALLVMDAVDGFPSRVSPEGVSTHVNATPIPGVPTGLAFDRSGRL